MAALAGVVHDGQGAAGHKHNGGNDNPQGGFHHATSLLRVPQTPSIAQINRASHERTVNGTACTEVQVRLLLRTMEIVSRTMGFGGGLLLHSRYCAREALGAASPSPLGGLQ